MSEPKRSETKTDAKATDYTKAKVPFAAALGGVLGEGLAMLLNGNPKVGKKLGALAGAMMVDAEFRTKAATALNGIVDRVRRVK